MPRDSDDRMIASAPETSLPDAQSRRKMAHLLDAIDHRFIGPPVDAETNGERGFDLGRRGLEEAEMNSADLLVSGRPSTARSIPNEACRLHFRSISSVLRDILVSGFHQNVLIRARFVH